MSVVAKVEIAKRKGVNLYFFDWRDKKQITVKQAKGETVVADYTVPNPYELGIDKPDKNGLYTTANEIAKSISMDWDNRTDPDIIAVVEEMGEKANGIYAELEVVEIPDGIEYEIDDYDGAETIREAHRTW